MFHGCMVSISLIFSLSMQLNLVLLFISLFNFYGILYDCFCRTVAKQNKKSTVSVVSEIKIFRNHGPLCTCISKLIIGLL